MELLRTARLGALAVAVWLGAGAALAAETLDTVRETGTFTIGFRTDAPPFASRSADGEPLGFTVAVCRDIAEAVQQALQGAEIEILYEPVNVEDRFQKLESGAIDILCGPTTITLDRIQRFDFTNPYFVTGGSVMIRADSGIESLADLAERRVGVLQNTTTESVLRDRRDEVGGVNPVPTHDAGFEQLQQGTIDAYIADRALLIGLATRSGNPEDFEILRAPFTVEPYGVAMRAGSRELQVLANTTLADLFKSATIDTYFAEAFGDAVPGILVEAAWVLGALPE